MVLLEKVLPIKFTHALLLIYSLPSSEDRRVSFLLSSSQTSNVLSNALEELEFYGSRIDPCELNLLQSKNVGATLKLWLRSNSSNHCSGISSSLRVIINIA